MAGHSKWSKIKREKGKTDAQRGKLFTKIGREIAVAVKMGGADPAANARLKDCISKARSNNMPMDNITRSIKKASGELGSINYENITYEGYGVDGVAVIVETLTDNKNRTAADVRHIFDKYGAGLGAPGCVSFMFDTKGVLRLDAKGIDEDTLMLEALELGADDVEYSSDSDSDGSDSSEEFIIKTAPDALYTIAEQLEKKGYKPSSSAIEKIPTATAEVKTPEKFTKMLDFFEDNDDVQEVYHNGV